MKIHCSLKSCLLAGLFLIPLISFSDSLAPQTVLTPLPLLKRLSVDLRGYEPSSEERDELRQIATQGEAAVEAYLAKKTAEYLKSEDFVSLMTYRMNALLRFSTPFFSSEVRQDPASAAQVRDLENHTANNLLRAIFTENRSWDEVLTAKSMRLGPAYHPVEFKTFDADVFSLFPELTGKAFPLDHTFKPTDHSIAGVLSTGVFRHRYKKTPINENRRYAQAVFRVFLCDDLVPAVPIEEGMPDKDKKALEDILNLIKKSKPNEEPTPQDIEDMMADMQDKHGTEATCMACHYKLDPMGRSFGTFGQHKVEPKARMDGGLVFKRVDGSEVKIENVPIDEIALAVTQTPEYARCQVRHFWDWVVGDAVVLTKQRETELVQTFDSVGRRAVDFVAALTRQPEYRYDRARPYFAEKLQLTFETVRPLFQKCDTCHATMAPFFPQLNFTLAERPWGGSIEEENKLIDKVKFRVNRPKNDPMVMPQAIEIWADKDLSNLKNWLSTLQPSPGGPA